MTDVREIEKCPYEQNLEKGAAIFDREIINYQNMQIILVGVRTMYTGFPLFLGKVQGY